MNYYNTLNFSSSISILNITTFNLSPLITIKLLLIKIKHHLNLFKILNIKMSEDRQSYKMEL
jgi:hypothetical protein